MATTAAEVERREVPVSARRSDTVLDEIGRVHEEILERARELFEASGCCAGHDLDNWLTAEREMIWRPAIELSEKDGVYKVEAAVAGIAPDELDVEVTSDDVLIRADVQHEHTEDKGTVHWCEFAPGKLFRSVRFPESVDPERVEAVYGNGLLELTVPIASGGGGRRSIDITGE